MELLGTTVTGIILIALGFMFGNYFCRYRIVTSTLSLNEVGFKGMSEDVKKQLADDPEVSNEDLGYLAMYVVMDVNTGKPLDSEHLEALQDSDNFWTLN